MLILIRASVDVILIRCFCDTAESLPSFSCRHNSSIARFITQVLHYILMVLFAKNGFARSVRDHAMYRDSLKYSGPALSF